MITITGGAPPNLNKLPLRKYVVGTMMAIILAMIFSFSESVQNSVSGLI